MSHNHSRAMWKPFRKGESLLPDVYLVHNADFPLKRKNKRPPEHFSRSSSLLAAISVLNLSPHVCCCGSFYTLHSSHARSLMHTHCILISRFPPLWGDHRICAKAGVSVIGLAGKTAINCAHSLRTRNSFMNVVVHWQPMLSFLQHVTLSS